MSDLAGNPEDRFSHNEAHLLEIQRYNVNMPMQYAAIFKGCKNDNFEIKLLIVFLFLLKT